MNPGVVLGALLVGAQCFGWAARVGAEPSPTDRICSSQLGAHIEAIVNHSMFQRARWGISIQTQAPIAERDTLYAWEADRYFIPASNVKLLTTAAVLTRLGAAFQVDTSVYWVDESLDSADSVTLHLVGRGDPSITNAGLQRLAQQIHDRGITQIDRLIVDDRYFQGAAIHPNWEWEDIQAGYGAPATSLMLNENAIGLTLMPQALGQPLRVVWDDPTEAAYWRIDNQSSTVEPPISEFIQITRDWENAVFRLQGQLQFGAEPESESIAVPNPTQHFVRHFRRVLAAEGVSVRQIQWSPNPEPRFDREIASIASPPLATLLVEANQDSNNLYAETLLQQLGTAQIADFDTSSREAGIVMLEETLSSVGIDPSGYTLVDGSGLSRHNLVSPDALVQTLQAMAETADAATYRDSLAIAGMSGTLRNRFVNTPVQGRLQGKTGAMSGVAALSGYLQPTEYPPLVFSILVNQFEQPVSEVRRAIDEMVLLLSRLQSC